MRIVSLAVLAACLSTTTLAADLDYAPLRGTQYGSAAEPIVRWDGAYIGGFAGTGRTNFDFDDLPSGVIANAFRDTVIESEYKISELPKMRDADGRSTVYGAFVGYNMQFDEVVFGIEADFSRGQFDGESQDRIARFMTTSDGYRHDVNIISTGKAQIKDYATLRARAGYTIGSFLPFVTGGVAVGRANAGAEVVLQDGFYNVAGRDAWLSQRQANLADPSVPAPPAFTDFGGYSSFNPVTGQGVARNRRIPR